MKILDQIHGNSSPLETYKRICVGNRGWLFFLYYECVTTLFTNIPGLLGIMFRRVFFKPLFKKIGKGTIFGSGISIRNPKSIELGKNVIFDSQCVIDAKNSEGVGISIGDNVFISRNVIMSGKNGMIEIGSDSSIGPNSVIHSVEECEVHLGRYNVIGAFCYFIGGGDYISSDRSIPMAKQGFKKGRPIVLEDDVWLGASVSLLEGSVISKGTVVGTNSVVKGQTEPYTIYVGNALATPIKKR